MNKVQFNLVPESKYDTVRSTKKRNMLLRVAFLATAVMVGVFILLLLVTQVIQKKQLSDANNNITAASKKLTGVKDINQILTVQSQLNVLPSLHSSKHVTSRVADYLKVVTPISVKVSRVTLDFSSNTMTIGGTANSQQAVNVFVDTLKSTTYTIGSGSDKTAFPSVVESNFGLSNNVATYELTIEFDPTLFSNNLVNSDGAHIKPQLKVINPANRSNSNQLFNGQG